MKQRLTIQRACDVLIDRVRFKNAGFTLPDSPYMQDDTDKIRETTKLYMESWVIPILQAIKEDDIPLLQELIQ